MRRRAYLRIRDLKETGAYDAKEEAYIKNEEILIIHRQWKIYLQRSGLPGKRVIEAVVSQFQKWLDRKHGSLEFRMVQLVTGHGSFGAYLFRIEKLNTDRCPL